MASNKKNLRLCEVVSPVSASSRTYYLFIGVDTLDQVDDIIQQWALDTFGEELDLPKSLTNNQDIMDIRTLPTTDNYVYLQAPVSAYMDIARYAGVKLPLPTFPAALSGGLYVMPEHNVYLFAAADYSGVFGEYTIPELGLTIAAGINYIGVTYNSGSPVYAVYSSYSSFNFSSIIPIATVLNFESVLYVIPRGGTGSGVPEQLTETRVDRDKFVILDPFTLTNNVQEIQLGTINVSHGLKETACLAADSGVDSMYLYFRDGSQVWQKSLITDYEETNYQSGAGIAALSVGEFVVNNIYRVVDPVNKLLFITLSDKFDTAIEAQNSEVDTDLPPEISESSVLVGRFIVEVANASLIKQKIQRVHFGVVA